MTAPKTMIPDTNLDILRAECERALELDTKATPRPWEKGRGGFWKGGNDRMKWRVYRAPDSASIESAIGPPWSEEQKRNGISGDIEITGENCEEDADAIAHSRTHSPRASRALLLAVEALREISGPTPGVFPENTGEGLAVSHERRAEKALVAIAAEFAREEGDK